MLIFAVITISSALIFYTLGVWGEKITGILKPWHLLMFWTGLIFDTTGTILMTVIADEPLSVNFHSVTGAIAIVLMAANAVWATMVLTKGTEVKKRRFHKFGLAVWFVWLIPYFSGMIYAMAK